MKLDEFPRLKGETDDTNVLKKKEDKVMKEKNFRIMAKIVVVAAIALVTAGMDAEASSLPERALNGASSSISASIALDTRPGTISSVVDLSLEARAFTSAQVDNMDLDTIIPRGLMIILK